MHSNETKDKFVELRSQGRSLCTIANELQVSKRTLVDWNQQFREEIRKLRAVELEALYDKILVSRERELKWMVQFEEQMAELTLRRGFAWMKDRDVLRFILLYRREIAQLRAEVLAPLEQARTPEPAKTFSPTAAPSPSQTNGAVSSPLVPVRGGEPTAQPDAPPVPSAAVPPAQTT